MKVNLEAIFIYFCLGKFRQAAEIDSGENKKMHAQVDHVPCFAFFINVTMKVC